MALAGTSVDFPETRVRFSVQAVDGDFVDEPEVVDRERFGSTLRRLRGQVRVRSGRQPVVAPDDEIVPLITNVCFRAVVRLGGSEHVAVNYTDSYGLLRLDREGATMRVSGDRLADIRVDAVSLMQALVDCGTRFIDWLSTCDLEGDIDRIVADLRAEEEPARAALASFG